MKKMLTKKHMILCIIFCFVIILGIALYFYSSPNVLEADYPYYSNISEITKAADVIVVGTVIDAKDVQKININTDTASSSKSSPIPYTISKIKVTNVIKGDVKTGDILEVKQLGDYKRMPEASLAEMNGYFDINDMELLFLASYDESPYSTLNPTQGAVKILEDQTLYSSSKYSLFGFGADAQSKVSTLESAIIEISKYVQ